MPALGAAYLAALLASAALLWLTIRLFGVRAGFGRALALAALLALVNLAIVGVARGLGTPAAGLVVVLLAWPVLPAVAFRLALPVGVPRAIGMSLVWILLKLAAAAVLFAALYPFWPGAFALPGMTR
jgi:hypothetical protein